MGIALLLAYSNSFHSAYVFDDRGSIHENETIRSLSTAFFPEGNSGNTVSGRPVLNFSFALNYAIHGEAVTGYHVANLLIHFCAALALFGFVRRTLLLPCLKVQYGAAAGWLALMVALLWAIHPLQTESVTYIVQRAESLVGLFYWLTLYGFVRAVGEQEPGRLKWKVLTIGSCMIGMGCKEVMAGAPLIVFLFDRTFVSGSFLEAWRARKKFYLVLASTWVLLAVCIIWTGKRGSTVGYNEFASWWRYGMTQGFAIIHYLRLVFWPSPLVLDYGKTLAADFADAGMQTFMMVLLAGVGSWAVWKKPRVGFLFALFFVVLAPSSSFVPVLTQTMAEHRMYLAIAPVVALIVLLAHKIAGPRVLAVWAGVAIVLGVVTFNRNHDYRTEESLWKTVTEKCPYNPRGWGALSSVYSNQNNFKEAKRVMRQGLAYTPKDPDALNGYARILVKLKETVEAEQVYRYGLDMYPYDYGLNCGMGTLMLDQGKPVEAKGYFERALAGNPDGVEAHYELGKAYSDLGRFEEAIVQFQRVIEKDPKTIDARNNLGNALISLNRPAEAIKVLEKAQSLGPKTDEVARSLGLALFSVNRNEEAIRQYETILKRSPNDAKAHANLGLVYATLNRPTEACEHYEAALAAGAELKTDMICGLRVSVATEWLKLGQPQRALAHYKMAVELVPADPNLRYLMANLLLQLRDPTAIPQYEQIVAQDPGNADAHNELGAAYLLVGRSREARQQFKAALAIQPAHPGAAKNLRNLDSSGR
jgi:tetratricopeptide (TPR) repeat protein